jgi:hypothetical protein
MVTDEWIKSSFCDSSACVEASWVRSSFCDTGTCVEASVSNDVFVRNSKDPDVAVRFSQEEWEAFVRGVKAGEFDLE